MLDTASGFVGIRDIPLTPKARKAEKTNDESSDHEKAVGQNGNAQTRFRESTRVSAGILILQASTYENARLKRFPIRTQAADRVNALGAYGCDCRSISIRIDPKALTSGIARMYLSS